VVRKEGLITSCDRVVVRSFNRIISHPPTASNVSSHNVISLQVTTTAVPHPIRLSPSTPCTQPDLYEDAMMDRRFIMSEGGNHNVCWNVGEFCVLYIAGLISEADPLCCLNILSYSRCGNVL